MNDDGNHERRTIASAFIGRERELFELFGGLQDAIASRGRLFLISGEPGIGKTQLAAELATRAATSGVRILWGRCWEGGGAPAYWPWVQVIRGLVFGSDAAEKVLSQLGVVESLEPQGGHVKPLPKVRMIRQVRPVPSSRPEADFADPQQRFKLFESVAALLKDRSRGDPLMVVLDDLHAADQPSLLMLQFVARQLVDSRIVVVGAYRDAEVRHAPALSRLIGDLGREATAMRLGGLTEAEVNDLVNRRSGAAVGREIVTALHRVTSGNPFFLDGIVRALVAEDKLAHQTRVEVRQLKLPENVRESIRSSLAILSEATRAVLDIASVIGNEFELNLVAQSAGLKAGNLVDLIDEASSAGVVARSPTSGTAYRFSHALIREFLYTELGTAERRRIHRLIAETLEKIYASRLESHLSELAHHFREASGAGTAQKAFDYSVRAGDAAVEVFAYEEAAAQWNDALGLAESLEVEIAKRAHLHHRIGSVSRAFDMSPGIEHLEAALKLYRQIDDKRGMFKLHAELGLAYAQTTPQMNLPLALNHYREAEALVEEGGDQASLGKLYLGSAVVCIETFRIDDGLTASRRAMEIHERLGDKAGWAEGAGRHSQFLMLKGRHAEATALLDRACAMATESAGPLAFWNAMFYAGFYRMFLRDIPEARRLLVLATERADLSRLARDFARGVLARTEMLAGDLAKSKSLVSDGPSSVLYRAGIAFREGDWEGAREIHQSYLDFERTTGSHWDLISALTDFADTLRAAGDYDLATSLLSEAMSKVSPDNLYFEMYLRPLAVLLAVDSGRPKKALTHLEICREIVAQGEDWMGRRGLIERAEAVALGANGGFSDAEPHFEKAVEILKQYSLPWDEADTLHYWGRVLLSAGEQERAVEKFDAAIEIYRRHGAGNRWIERVESDRRRALRTLEERQLARVPKPQVHETFLRDGEFWTVSFRGQTTRLKDAKGLHYIARLLRSPGEEVAAIDLVMLIADGDSTKDQRAADLGDAGEILDAQARANYKRRLDELREEIDHARKMNDLGASEQAEAEYAALAAHLAAASGLGGRIRRTGSHRERARVAVTRSIRGAIENLRLSNPTLRRHLATSIRTGHFCCYVPAEPVVWQF